MKKLLIILSLLLTPILLMGCAKKEAQVTPETEKTEDSTVKSDDSTTKSDDLYSFEVSVNDKLYKLPVAYSEFEANGWSMKSKDSTVLAPNQYTMSNQIVNGKKQIYVKLFNDTANELPLTECKVSYVKLDSYDAKYGGATLVLPQGISLDSTKDDVTKAYGNPSNSRDTDDTTFLTYEVGTYQSVAIDIDNKTGKVNAMSVENLVKTSDTASSTKSSTSSEVPDSVTNYKAPTELTDDITSFNAKYDGVIYHMPAPFAEFEKNGWVIQDAPKDDIAARDTASGVVLRKGNQTFRTSLYNNSAKATNAKNCFVTTIKADDSTSQIPIELPKGIKVGSTKADVEAAYAGDNLEKDDSGTLEYYTYSKKVLQEIKIIVRKETGIVSTIEILYQPNKSGE